MENSFITIVSGLPRSGTSMMMQAIEAGGIPALTDGIREKDVDNPKGYYEFEVVKKTKTDSSWVSEAEGKVVTISGDTVPCDGIVRLAKDADLLVQCCHFPKSLETNPVMKYLKSSILPSSGQVGAIAAEAGVKQMILTHLSSTITQANFPEILEDIRAEYQGNVLLGRDLMQIEV